MTGMKNFTLTSNIWKEQTLEDREKAIFDENIGRLKSFMSLKMVDKWYLSSYKWEQLTHYSLISLIIKK